LEIFSLEFVCAGSGIVVVVVVYLDLVVAIVWCSGRKVLFLRLFGPLIGVLSRCGSFYCNLDETPGPVIKPYHLLSI
jgi:hypothetical protein